jgi:hypothetical protein
MKQKHVPGMFRFPMNRQSAVRIVLEDFEAVEPIGHSPLRFRFEGDDWSVGSSQFESLGVVVPKVIEFARNGSARHWGPFAGRYTPEGVINTVTSHVLPPGGDSDPRSLDISAALHRYVLSALFEANLGADCVVSVRGGRYETIIVRSLDGVVEAHQVSIKNFDRAVYELEVWYETVLSSCGHDEPAKP